MAGKQITGAANQWLNVNELAGFTVGFFQNQTGYTIEAIESEAAPTSAESGRWIYPGYEAVVDSGSPGLWVRSPQPIWAYVQEAK